jgi:threonylcarbamoyladenosine tRNA methylthiotransferase MtaB
MPDAAIGADVMTGFPGETEAEFEESVRFIEEQPFSYLHVFSYSERPGTRAAEQGGAVPPEIRQRRTAALRAISERKNKEFRRRMLGKTLSGVTLEQAGMALTSNFLKVEMKEQRAANQVVDLKICALSETGLREQSLLTVL